MINGVKVIGVICAAVNKEPAMPLVDNLAKLVHNSSEYRVLVFQCFEDLYHRSPNDIGGLSVFSLINYNMVDVLVIVPASFHSKEQLDELVEECLKHDVPLISVDIPLPGAYCVSFDYMGSFGSIIEHTMSVHGCKKIKVVAGIKNNEFSEMRIDTCRNVMKAHDIVLSDDDIWYCDFWEGPTYEAMDRFFASGEELPDAFVCCNDSMAMAVCLKLNEHGISVPGDVIVTGFDGILMEKFHKPRLTTAVRNNKSLAETVLKVADDILSGKAEKPYRIDLDYDPVFSESCGCGCASQTSENLNRMLANFVQGYSYALNYEEYVNNMENRIAADPSPGNVKKVVSEFCFLNSIICLTDEFYSSITGGEDQPGKFDGFGNMHVFVSTYDDGRKTDGLVFPAARLMPLLEKSFSEYNTMIITALHFQDSVQGYIVMHYSTDEHHNERMYTFCTSLNRSLETMRIHEHMSSLNRRLEFMFTHDQLTRIYNRYGFYNGFRDSYQAVGNKKCDVFVVSIDLNDMKYINDTYGHSAGDDALCITSKALSEASSACGDGVVCSRFGGDEFVAAKICKGDAQQQAEVYRDAFAKKLEQLNASSGHPYKVKVGIGVYSASLEGVDSIDGLIELADRLMYSDKAKHKRHPRNTI